MRNLSVHTMKPLGEQLLEYGLLSEEQLGQALYFQQQAPDKLLGQILIENNFLTEAEFEAFMQTRIGIQQPLGELLVQKGFISREELSTALSIQMQSGPTAKPLGELLVERGAIEKAVLDEIVKHQYEIQEKVRKNMARAGKATPKAYERSQVEDIQNLLASGQVFLALAHELLPEAAALFEARFQSFQQLYSGERRVLSEELQDAVAKFFVHFLPILEMGVELENLEQDSELEQKYEIMNTGFFALIEGFQRLLLPDLKLQALYYLNSLVLTKAPDSVSLREALWVVMRSPELLPHGSLTTLRFLLNEFWGQRSILEQRGMRLVRHEDEVDLEDFFRPRIVTAGGYDKAQDLDYIAKMEDHIFEQIETTSLALRQSEPEEMVSHILDLTEFLRTLLQTHKDWAVTNNIPDEDEEPAD